MNKPVAKYLQSKEFREHRIWSIINDNLVTKEGDEYLTEDEFNQRFPPFLPTTLKTGRENIDKTRAWINQ